ncbi:MAG: FAD-dependent 5-carboxymethylaminomethyl-2-thiouridine(34) oxidoreductase MnmC [Caldimonas sp.]
MADDVAALLQSGGLPERWRGRERFTVIAAGASAAKAFVAAWRAWRADECRCARLDFIALVGTLGDCGFPCVDARPKEPADDPDRLLAAALPPPTPDLHRLAFDAGRVQLLLVPGDPARALREVVARIDVFLVGGVRGAGEDPLVNGAHFAKALARLAAPAATLAVDGLDAASAKALEAVGFVIERGPDRIVCARYEPQFAPRTIDTRRVRKPPDDRRAVVVGAGLAGCAVAWALAEQGWQSVLLERHRSIAGEASGNPAGLFHGIVNGQDGTHARFNRAAALEAQRAATLAIGRHAVPGAVDGLLQIVDAQASVGAMHALLRRLGLPDSYVQALDADAASACAGVRIERPAWFYPGGGWIEPGGLARSFVERAAASVEVRCGVAVARLRRAGASWQLLDADGSIVERATTLVLANAGEALRLAGGAWPVEKVRGQISLLRRSRTSAWQLPRVPISGAGYLLPEVDGLAVFGSTAAAGDDDPTVRPSDHAQNLDQLARLAPACGLVADAAAAGLQGRTAWRWVSRDRLPLVGPVPRWDADALSTEVDRRVEAIPTGFDGGTSRSNDTGAADRRRRSMRTDQPRFTAREPGLYIYTALGSRGITWAALGAQVLASSITGTPSPVESSLLDALDPARFGVRAQRRSGPR